MGGPARPDPSEHHPYYGLYIGQLPEGDILEILEGQLRETLDLLERVPPERETHRYGPGKWSIREVVGHVLDVERVFAFRALCFARNDPGHLPDMDQELWAAHAAAGDRPLSELSEELRLVRAGNVAMFRAFEPATWLRSGTASGRRFTVRSCPWIIAGHELHHRTILRERYLAGLGGSA